MKVALFSDTFLPQVNGVTKTLDRLTDYFTKQGIDYLVFAPEDKKGVALKKNTERMFSFSFFLYPECRVSLPNYFKIKKLLDDYSPDLVHLVTPFNLGLCGLKYAQSSQVPVVASYHTNFTKYLNHYNLNILERPIWRFFRWFHSHSERNFCPSQATLEELAAQGIENLEIWDRGINPDLYSPQLRSEDLRAKYSLQDKLCLLYVGRLAPEKNLYLLLESLEQINQNYQKEVELLITGDGPLLADLKAEAPENVTFTGYLKGRELSQTYASADVFLFPSTTETYGNVVLEAMASGLPVVGILAGGVKENLIDGYNCLACQENSVAEFTANLERMINEASLRDRLSKQARQHALNKSWDQVFSRLVSSYQEVINSKEQQIISA
ncbi:MAG: glycosyltransferase family 4 protein [Bacillota bacterium]